MTPPTYRPAAQFPERCRQGDRLAPGRSPVARMIGEILLVPGAVLFWVICMGVLS
jgi:hypothetical protein